jgi:hypothetical protein
MGSSDAAPRGDGDPEICSAVTHQGDPESLGMSGHDLLEELGFMHKFDFFNCLDWKSVKEVFECAIHHGLGIVIVSGESCMAKGPIKEIELHPDAWERFEGAVKVVAKSPPQHRIKPKAKKAKAKKAKNELS